MSLHLGVAGLAVTAAGTLSDNGSDGVLLVEVPRALVPAQRTQVCGSWLVGRGKGSLP